MDDVFDFSRLLAEADYEENLEKVENQLAQMKKFAPQLYNLFAVGRLFGRHDIVVKLMKIVEEEATEFKKFNEEVNGK